MDCPKCGGEMWDNRGRKTNPKAPDFKCKDKDCDGVIWPPRGAKSSAPTRSAPKSGNGNDDRSNRIERQHSQSVAVEYAALKGLTNITTDELRSLIDWFHRDVSRMPTTKQSEPEHQPDTTPDDDEF